MKNKILTKLSNKRYGYLTSIDELNFLMAFLKTLELEKMLSLLKENLSTGASIR